MRAPYPVTLTQTDDGGIMASVGCKTLIFVNVAELVPYLRRYFTEPEATIKEFESRFGWKTAVQPQPAGYDAPAPPGHPYPGNQYNPAREAIGNFARAGGVAVGRAASFDYSTGQPLATGGPCLGSR